MVTEIEAIHRVFRVFQESGIEYMIVGSYAASLHGFIRTTHDLDLVVCLRPEQVSALASALSDEFHLDMESAREAVEQHDVFNAITLTAGSRLTSLSCTAMGTAKCSSRGGNAWTLKVCRHTWPQRKIRSFPSCSGIGLRPRTGS